MKGEIQEKIHCCLHSSALALTFDDAGLENLPLGGARRLAGRSASDSDSCERIDQNFYCSQWVETYFGI